MEVEEMLQNTFLFSSCAFSASDIPLLILTQVRTNVENLPLTAEMGIVEEYLKVW